MKHELCAALTAIAVLFGAGCSESGSSGPGAGATRILVQALNADLGDAPAADANVYLDGELAGQTAADGTLSLAVSEGKRKLLVVQPGIAGGSLAVTPVSKQTTHVIVRLESKGAARPARLTSSNSKHVLEASSSEYRLACESLEGDPIVLSALNHAVAQTLTSNLINVTNFFSVDAAGELVCTGTAALRQALVATPSAAEWRFEFSLTDEDGIEIVETIGMRVGQGSVTGVFEAPPSNPGLALDDLDVSLELLDYSPSGRDYVFQQSSTAAGTFAFADLPSGTYAFNASRQQGGETFITTGSVFLINSVDLTATPCGSSDLLAGVPMLQVNSGSAPENEFDARREWVDHRAMASGLAGRLEGGAAFGGSGNSVSVSAVSDTVNVPVSDIATLDVPEGTKSLQLSFEVCSDEYVYGYVQAQSQWNDNWQVQVFSNANLVLYQITRNVNSQLFIDPIWQPDGCTGTILAKLDVSNLTDQDDAQINVRVSATNIGDDFYPTGVNATLSIGASFDVVQVEPLGGSSFYSMPADNEFNHFQRDLRVLLARPPDSTIEHLILELCSASDLSVLQTIYDGPLGPFAVAVAPNELRVRASFGGNSASNLGGAQASLHNIVYRVFVTIDDQGTQLTRDRYSTTRQALWRMPSGFDRYGLRDTGQDDWCSKGAYEWLSTNQALLANTRIDDISGEHARDIGHATHDRGTDIDLFHFFTLDPASGAANYLTLQAVAGKAVQGAPAALTYIRDWILAERTGLSPLLSNTQVERVITGLGAAHGLLPAGWYRDLLMQGFVTLVDHSLLDTGLGVWDAPSFAQLRHDQLHNSHHHLDLKDNALNNAP